MSISLLDDYHNTTKPKFNTLLTKVTNGVYGHAADFPAPTITAVNFGLRVTGYRDANNQYEAGGHDFKADYDMSKTLMIEDLDTVKKYVEELPGFSVDLGNLSGFTVNKQGISSGVVPGQPVFRLLTRLGSGTHSFDFEPVDGAEYYGTYLIEGDAMPAGAIFTNGILDFPGGTTVRILHNCLKQKLKIYYNLIAGKTYTIFAYAGNSAGVSILSDGLTFTASNK